MNRHLRNAAAFVVGILLSFLLMAPTAFAAERLIAGAGSTTITTGRFVSGSAAPAPRFTTSPSVYQSYTASNDSIYVTRKTPFNYLDKYGKAANGDIYDVVKLNKATLAPKLGSLMKGGLVGLGMLLLQDYAMQKGFEWMDAAKQYYKMPVTGPGINGDPAMIPASQDALIRSKCGTDYDHPTYGFIWGGKWELYNGSTHLSCYQYYTGPASPGVWILRSRHSIPFPGCPSNLDYVNGSCVAKKGPATDSEISTFINDTLANAPDRAIKDLIAAGIPAEYAEQPSKSLASPVITLPTDLEKSTSINPDGSTVTNSKQSTTEVKVSPDGQVSETETITDTAVNKDPQGNTTSNSSTETKKQEEPLPSVADPSMPAVPTLYSQKYPNGLKGVWDAKKAALQNTAFVQSISSLAPSNWNSGSCPSWTINFNLAANANYGNQVFPFPCWLVPFLKAALLLTAAFTARKLIWG